MFIIHRAIVGDERFIEIFVDCSIEVCIERDPKGIYAKALAGEIDNFTGISAPYEPPENSEIVVKADKDDFVEVSKQIVDFVKDREFILSTVKGDLIGIDN